MKEGTVKFYNDQKGFGFIKSNDSDRDVFVHSSGLLEHSIKEEDKVSFDTQESEKGLRAINVKRIK